MINHARTLLLNQAPETAAADDTGYEYIPEEFKVIPLPTTLGAIHRIIFGVSPDNYFRNFRVRELLNYIHQTELQNFVAALDPRVTYWPETTNVFYGAAKKILVRQITGQPARLNIGGTLSSSNAAGRSEYDYTILLGKKNISDSDYSNTVITQPLGEEAATTVFPENTTRFARLQNTALTAAIDLSTTVGRLMTEVNDIFIVEDYTQTTGGEMLLEQVAQSTMLSLTAQEAGLDSVTAAWTISARANPQAALISVLPNLEFLGEPVYLDLFGAGPKEPYATFQNLWESHPLPTYRLSGILLAFIYRMNERLRI
jgi:hypothetical protein